MLVACIVAGAGWSSMASEATANKNRLTANKIGLSQTEEMIRVLSRDLEDYKLELEYVKTEVAKYQNITQELQKAIKSLEADIPIYEDLLKKLQGERDVLKSENTNLHSIQTTLLKDRNNLTAIMKTLNTTVNLVNRHRIMWALGQSLGLVLDIAIGIEDWRRNTKLWEADVDLHTHKNKYAALDSLSEGFENYVFLRKNSGTRVARTICFQGTNKNELSKCVGKHPTITTITTTDGYRFAVVLDIPWPAELGPHSDARAFAISSNHAARANVRSGHPAIYVNASLLLQFGTTDIMIALDGKTGTAFGDAFDIPSPYGKDTFFHNGSVFDISNIEIETITFPSYP